jgi:hypothetical protein
VVLQQDKLVVELGWKLQDFLLGVIYRPPNPLKGENSLMVPSREGTVTS